MASNVLLLHQCKFLNVLFQNYSHYSSEISSFGQFYSVPNSFNFSFLAYCDKCAGCARPSCGHCFYCQLNSKDSRNKCLYKRCLTRLSVLKNLKVSLNTDDKELGEINEDDDDVKENSSEQDIVILNSDEENDNDKKAAKNCVKCKSGGQKSKKHVCAVDRICQKRPRASAAFRIPSKASFQQDQNDDDDEKENIVMPKKTRRNKKI